MGFAQVGLERKEPIGRRCNRTHTSIFVFALTLAGTCWKNVALPLPGEAGYSSQSHTVPGIMFTSSSLSGPPENLLFFGVKNLSLGKVGGLQASIVLLFFMG